MLPKPAQDPVAKRGAARSPQGARRFAKRESRVPFASRGAERDHAALAILAAEKRKATAEEAAAR